MKQLSDYLNDQNKKADINESMIFATAAVVGCFAWAGAYFVNQGGLKTPFEGLFKPFKELAAKRRERRENKYRNQQEELRKKIEQAKEKRDAPKEIERMKQELALIEKGFEDDQITEILAAQSVVKKGLEQHPTNLRFKGFDSMLKLEAAAMYDEEGNPRNSEEMQKKFKEYLGEDKCEDFAADCKENLVALDVASVKDQIGKGLQSVSEENLQEFENEMQETAKQAHNEIAEAKENGEEPQFLKDCKELRNPGKEEKKDDEAPSDSQKEEPKDDESKDEKEEAPEEPKGEEKKDDEAPSNDEIDKMQDKLTDDKLDKDEKKEIEKELKDAAEKRGEDPEEYVPQEVTGKNGKVYQKKIGPRGGKYYRVKGKENWRHGTPVTEGIVNYLKSRIID